MRNTGREEAQAGIKIAGRNINNLRYADNTTLMAESEEKLKRLLMKVKEESEKVGLKLNIQKAKIMASGLITSWKIDGETVESVSDFSFFGSKITAERLRKCYFCCGDGLLHLFLFPVISEVCTLSGSIILLTPSSNVIYKIATTKCSYKSLCS